MDTNTSTSRKTKKTGKTRFATTELNIATRVPEALASEAAVLSSMMIKPDCIGAIVELLEAAAFYRLEHQLIYEAIIAVYEKTKGGGLDAILVRQELEKRGDMEQIGGIKYFAQVLESAATGETAEYHARIVRDAWVLRELLAAASEIEKEVSEPGGEVNEILDKAEQRIFAVANKKSSNAASPVSDLVHEVYELIENREGGQLTGLPTGYFELDDMTCGLQRGEMIIVAGRPSMGKTSFVMNIAEHLAIKEGIPTAFFSLEMGKHQLVERLFCSVSMVDSQAVRKGNLRSEDYHALAEASTQLAQAPIYIDDTAGISPLELRAKARRLKSRYGIECIMIDYLQLMSIGSGRSESRQQEITTISRYVKSLARELNVPVIILSQLNRAAENRDNHRPRMSDLRESGSIEQDADVIMLLHREDYYNKNNPDYEPTGKAEVIIAKQRNGPTGNVELLFREQLTRFENLAAHIEEPF